MKHINITFTDEEFKELETAKSKVQTDEKHPVSWHDMFLKLCKGVME